MTRVAFVAGRWIVGTVASVLALERFAYLAAQPLAWHGRLGSVTLGSDRPHGPDALAEVVRLQVATPVPRHALSAQPARVLSGCEPATDTAWTE